MTRRNLMGAFEPDRDYILDSMRKYFSQIGKPVELTEETRLDDAGLDSLDVVDFLLSLEHAAISSVSDYPDSLHTVEDVINYVQESYRRD